MWLTRNHVFQTLFCLVLQALPLAVSANTCLLDPTYLQQGVGAGKTWSYYFAEQADTCQRYQCVVAQGPGIINPALGTINWTPGGADQGVHAITVGHRLVTVVPLNGFTVLLPLISKDICLTVYPANRPPVIDSRPPADSIGLRSTFAYTVRVTEPDGEAVSYALLQGPPGMTLDAASGLLQWTPTIAGDYPVIIEVADASGSKTQQSFTVNVTPSESPLCAGIYPNVVARATQPMKFEFNCLAMGFGSCKLLSGPIGLTLTDENLVVPPSSTLSPTHFLHWSPGQTQLGKYIVKAQNVYGGTVYHTYDICVEVLANSTHDIVSRPPTTDIVVGDTFIYQVVTDDRENDPVTYELISAPAGLAIDASTGLLAGSPSAPGTYTVAVRATDSNGTVVQQTFSLQVAAPPPVIVSPSPTYRSGTVPSGTSEMVYVHTDIGGSPLARTNAAGNLVTRTKFSPYGDQLTAPGATDDKVAYGGHTFDAELGLNYMGARHYDPFVGRFMGMDPIGVSENNPHSFNRYTYANNNPYKFVDPDGRSAFFKIVKFAMHGGDVAATFSDIAENVADITSGSASFGTKAFAFASILSEFTPVGINDIKWIGKGVSRVAKSADNFVDLTTPARRRHILDGDATGGGHRPGTGKPGKSEFPAGRSDDSIIHDISDIATDPTLRSRPGRGGRTITDGTRNGVDIRVIQERNGDIVTGFPTNTPRNPR